MRLYFKLLAFFILVSFRSFSNDCGKTTVPLGTADGSFESCAGVAKTTCYSDNGTGAGVTCGGWINNANSADAWNSPVPDNSATCQSYAALMPSSPDGSIFAAIVNLGGWIESFYTDIENLSIGEKYTVTFYYANAGVNAMPVHSDSAAINVIWGSGPGAVTKTTEKLKFEGYGNQVWVETSLDFFATATTERLEFMSIPIAGEGSYIAIDGVKVTFDDNSNTPPVAADDGNALNEGSSVFGNVLFNDSDPENDPLEFHAITQMPSHGNLTINSDGDYTYEHDGTENFSDIFTYVATDGECYDTADVVISIVPVNDPPAVVKDTFFVNEGDTLIVLPTDPKLIINNDLDPDNPTNQLKVNLEIPPLYHNGSFSFSDNKGSFTYIHNCNDANMDVIQYSLEDNDTVSKTMDSVIIFILNEAPIGENDNYSVQNAQTITVDETVGLLINDVDSNACDILRVSLVKAPQFHMGVFDLDTNGVFTYTHDGTLDPTQDYFVYQLSDGEDNAIETDTVFITIINSGPNTQSYTYFVDEGKQLVVDSAQGVLSASSSNLGLSISAEIHQLPQHGTLLPLNDISENGSFIYQHDCTDNPNEDYFLFKVKDSLTFTIDTVKITIENVCPIGQNDFYTVTEGQSININNLTGVLANDVDDNSCDVLSVNLVTPPLYHTGGFSLNPDGSFTYTHNDAEEFVDQFSYRLSDGECTGAVYTVIINVDSVSDKPPVVQDDSYVPCIDEGGTLDVVLVNDGVLGNDNDPDFKDSVLTAHLVDDVLNGTLTFNDNGTFTYTHDGGEETVDYFTYVAFDGDFYSVDTAMVTLCINQINDCPVANDDSFIINEGFVLDSTVAANDTDGDINTDDNNYVLLTFPAVGQIEMRSDGSFVYTSPTQISAPGPEIVTFQYLITDPDPSTACSTTADVTIRINSFNDCPVALDDTITVNALSNDIVLVDLVANDYDIDNPLDLNSLFIVDSPLYGDINLYNDGTLTYDYQGSPSKSDSLTYAIQDSIGCISNYAKLHINIDNIQFPDYELPTYFTPNSDKFNDFFTIKCENISIENVKFEVKIMDRYQRIVYESVHNTDNLWDGSNQKTGGEAQKGVYFYEITPIEYNDVRAKPIVGVLFLDR